MYPLLLKPTIKNYIWGGRRLIDEFGFDNGKTPAAEAWILSCREGDECEIQNGEYKGRPISAAPWIDKNTFPVLVKLIDAARDLSIQIHPSHECAAFHEGDEEKTEMWYIVDCDEGAEVILGFNEEFESEKKKLDKREFRHLVEKYINEGKILDICRRVKVHPGDMIFVEPGTIHAICGGILIAEIQQNSDTTYRVYDYGRLGADGKPRELHIERALDALTLAPREHLPALDAVVPTDFGEVRLVMLGDVAASIITLKGECSPETELSYHIFVLEGEATLSWDGGTLSLKKSDSVLVPKALAHTIAGDAKLIVSHVVY